MRFITLLYALAHVWACACAIDSTPPLKEPYICIQIYIYIYILYVVSWIFLIQKTNPIIFQIRCSSLNMVFFLLFTCYIKCFQFWVVFLLLFYESMFCFSVILGALNLIAFVKYYCIQKSKLKLEKGFVKVHDDY